MYSTFFCFSSSKRFLFQSQWYWHFFSFSSSDRSFYLPRAFFCLFSFSSSERFWYLSRASYWHYSLSFLIMCINHFFIYIQKKNYKKYFLKYYLNCFKNNCFVFLNFSKNLREYIRRENLSYKIVWNYSKIT